MWSQEWRTGKEYEAVRVCALDLISFIGTEVTVSLYPFRLQHVGLNHLFHCAEMISAVQTVSGDCICAQATKWSAASRAKIINAGFLMQQNVVLYSAAPCLDALRPPTEPAVTVAVFSWQISTKYLSNIPKMMIWKMTMLICDKKNVLPHMLILSRRHGGGCS